MMKKNYIIPYGERSTNISDGSPTQRSLICVDNLGLFVEHNKGKKPTAKEVRGHLIGWNPQNEILVQAKSLQAALEEFYNYPECKTGTKYKAWEMVDSKHNPIIEYSGCKHMKVNGYVMCTKYDEPEYTSNMYCILDGLDDPPLGCPIDKQLSHHYREETIMIGGIWIRRYHRTVSSMEPQINGLVLRKANSYEEKT